MLQMKKRPALMNSAIQVGVIGDFNPSNETHRATDAALKHAADQLSVPIHVEWIPTLDLARTPADAAPRRFHALWCAPASPYRCMIGALEAIRFAREAGWPFFGT
jgi:CTP synthase (UTP-ammonia lyase)